MCVANHFPIMNNAAEYGIKDVQDFADSNRNPAHRGEMVMFIS